MEMFNLIKPYLEKHGGIVTTLLFVVAYVVVEKSKVRANTDDHSAINDNIARLFEALQGLEKKIERVFIKDKLENQIMTVANDNLKYFNARMQKHLLINVNHFISFSTKMFSVGLTALNDSQVDAFVLEALTQNKAEKNMDVVDRMLIQDWFANTDGAKVVDRYISEIKKIINDKRNHWDDRFITLTLQIFNETLDEMFSQSQRLIANGFDFKIDKDKKEIGNG